MKLIKNINPGKVNFFKIFLLLYLVLFSSELKSDNTTNQIASESNVIIKILDKISSKTNNLSLKINQEKKFKNLVIKVLKCKNSEFDDNPEITAYLQVKDVNDKSKDEVFIFNDWAFASSPSLRPFDHPVYDIWLIKCY